MEHKKTFNLRTLVLIGVLSALVYALSSISIQIPLSFSEGTRIHFGNIICLLGGVLFGPLVGGLSAGLGSMIFDLSNPMYASEFWITFINKFAMGFVAGWLAHHSLKQLPAFPRALVAGMAGQLTYILLYLAKSAVMIHFITGTPWEATFIVLGGMAMVSTFNGVMAVAACSLLAPPLLAGLNATGFYRNKSGHPAQ